MFELYLRNKETIDFIIANTFKYNFLYLVIERLMHALKGEEHSSTLLSDWKSRFHHW